MRRLLFFAVFVFWMTVPAHSEVVYCTNCSDRFMQALDRVTNVEQLQRLWAQYKENVVQTAQQIRMVQQNIERYKNMLKNTKNLEPEMVNAMVGDFRRIAENLNKLKTQKGDTEALAQVYTATFPEYAKIEGIVAKSPEDSQAEWEKWSQTVDEVAQAIFQLTGWQLNELSNSDEFSDHIKKLLSTPEGRMQALQAGNQLTAILIKESRELRALLASKAQSDVVSQQKKEKQEQKYMAIHKSLTSGTALDGIHEEPPEAPDNSF